MKSLAWHRFVFSTALLATTLATVAPRPAQAQAVAFKPDRAPQAPEFVVRGLNGESVRLSSYRGRPVLLVLWATWCPACRRAMPLLNELHRRYSARGLVMLAVSDEDAGTLARFGREQNLSIPMANPGAGMEQYSTGSVPSTMLINARGQLVFVEKGFSDETQPMLAKFIEQELPVAKNLNALPTQAPTAKNSVAKSAPKSATKNIKPTAKTATSKTPASPSAAQRALAQSRAKVPAQAKSNGIFVLDDDGLKPAR